MTGELHHRLGYRFRRDELLQQALTHRSFGARHNERLEFIGDAVLNCIVAQALYDRFPGVDEGELSRMRANLVNRDTLTEIARRLELNGEIRIGEGELRSGGANRPSILADALEAVYGAVFLDGGFDAARDVIDRTFDAVLREADPAVLGKDPKTRLQEWLQARRHAVPEYRVVAISGEAHAQLFTAECVVAALGIAMQGTGSSRRAAEQAAAATVYASVLGEGAARL
ncbi:MAG TPA: ribonuclease III [Casimicrobiaceae bacterium]|nr:ribonuclease III [Casimicrobiaceae bacterium]